MEMFLLPVEVCPSLIAPENGFLNTTMSVFGTVVEVKCKTGYRFADKTTSVNLQCLDGQGWSRNHSDCTG